MIWVRFAASLFALAAGVIAVVFVVILIHQTVT